MKRVLLVLSVFIYFATTFSVFGQSNVHGKLLERKVTHENGKKCVYEEYADGFFQYTKTSPCEACTTPGECKSCNGSGISPASGMFMLKCPLCGGNGQCFSCKGKGESMWVFSGNKKNAYKYSGGSSYSGGNSSRNSGTSSNSNESSVYTKCTSCNGTGVCSGCHGTKGSWQDTGYYTGSGSQSWINCGSCRGSGRCPICYGRGKL